MSEKTIWDTLRSNGLSEAGAAGVMGNLYCESLLSSTNVEDRSGIPDATYTNLVDSGQRSRDVFAYDSYGYGLAQWTYYTRKQGLYDLAKKKGVSIGDETMQVEWLLSELSGYASLLSYLKSTTDVSTASNRFCNEFERPAVNNYTARYNASLGYYNKYHGTAVTASAATASSASTASVTTSAANTTTELASFSSYEEVRMPILSKGDKGIPVGMAQLALQKKGYSVGAYGADCDFGASTLIAVNLFKAAKGILNVGTNYGVIDGNTWAALIE